MLLKIISYSRLRSNRAQCSSERPKGVRVLSALELLTALNTILPALRAAFVITLTAAAFF
jgi:hypothetical protein